MPPERKTQTSARYPVADAACAMCLPVATPPVSEIMSTRGCSTSAEPAVAPRPQTTLSTPGGRMSWLSSARRSAVSGVSSEGLRTIVLPAAMAGPIFHVAMFSG